MSFEQLKQFLTVPLTRFFTYDAVAPPRTDGADHLARHAALALTILFSVFGFALVGLDLVDNKPTVASTGLVTAHRHVTHNLAGWFTEGIWWRGQQTPTPLPVTLHGLFFAVFGYSVRGILYLHVVLGALSAWLLYRIATRRFGPASGLLAMALYLTAPLFLYVTLSGWTFVWATMFLLLAIDLVDRAVIGTRVSLYLLAALALGCAGMSLPENYSVALLMVLFVPFRPQYRALFLLIALAYPLAQYAHNHLYLGDAPGLRILADARAEMGYAAIFREWFASVEVVTLDRNFATLYQWMLIPSVVFFGLPRNRFLTGVLVYFCVAFFGAYAMRRISFNHEGYYFAHVALAMPFLAAMLAWFSGRIGSSCRRIGHARRAAIPAAVTAILLLTLNIIALRDVYEERLFFRVPEPVRELRNELRTRLEADETLVLDYFAEVSWMRAEIETDTGTDNYYYTTSVTGVPRPRLNPARKDIQDDECEEMNGWVGRNFRRWCEMNEPRYVVLLSDAAWERGTRQSTGHYRMFGLRPALAVTGGDDLGRLLGAQIGRHPVLVFANSDFYLYDLRSDTKNADRN